MCIHTTGGDHLDTIASMNCLAMTYKNMSDFIRAEPLLLECMDIRKRVLGR